MFSKKNWLTSILLFAVIATIFGCNSNEKTDTPIEIINTEPESVDDTTTFKSSTGKYVRKPLKVGEMPNWDGPLLLVYSNDALTINDCYKKDNQFISLEDNVEAVKDYLNSDTLITIGEKGIQIQSFKNAFCRSNGECSTQIALELEKPEPKGFLAAKGLFKTDSIQFFNTQNKDTAIFKRMFKKEDGDKFARYKHFITNNNKVIISVRGNGVKVDNEELGEEWVEYYGMEYRYAYKNEKGKWIILNWTPCLKKANDPAPNMVHFGENNIRIIWGFSEAIGDYQMYVSKINMADKKPTFKNGRKMQGAVSLGCD